MTVWDLSSESCWPVWLINLADLETEFSVISRTLLEFYDQKQMIEHKWLIDRLICFAVDNINLEEKFAGSLRENINYLANEIRHLVNQFNTR